MKRAEVERQAKLKLFHRLLISYNDFRQASQIASYILKHKLQEKVERLRGERRYRIKLLWQALNCAMVVAYARPFSGNDRRTANRVPDLPARFVKALTPEEREIHALAMQDRNTLLAHSDSDAWNMRPILLETAPGHRILLPLHHDVRAPLVHEVVQQLNEICGKLMELVFEERLKLEKELADMLPSVSAADLAASGLVDDPADNDQIQRTAPGKPGRRRCSDRYTTNSEEPRDGYLLGAVRRGS